MKNYPTLYVFILLSNMIYAGSRNETGSLTNALVMIEKIINRMKRIYVNIVLYLYNLKCIFMHSVLFIDFV